VNEVWLLTIFSNKQSMEIVVHSNNSLCQ